MKASGFVVSTRGKLGGDQLNRAPHQITLAEVMMAIEGPKLTSGNRKKEESSMTQSLREVWNEASHAQQEVLQSVTAAELLDQTCDSRGMMCYI